MPIIAIEALVDDEPDLDGLLGDTAASCAEALGIEVRYCWVTFRHLASGSYFEGGKVRESSEWQSLSPLVRVSLYRGQPAEAKRRMLVAIAEAVGRGLSVPSANVYVELRELPEGSVFAGGKVL